MKQDILCAYWHNCFIYDDAWLLAIVFSFITFKFDLTLTLAKDGKSSDIFIFLKIVES